MRIGQRTKNLGRRRRMRADGMTLIEIMVVLVIMGTIAGLVAVTVMDRLQDANAKSAKIQMANLKQALDLFKLDNGFYPDGDQGLQALVVPPTTGRQVRNYRPAGYLKDGVVPVDPWGTPYGYVSNGIMFQIFSAGEDGQFNTGDDIKG